MLFYVNWLIVKVVEDVYPDMHRVDYDINIMNNMSNSV